jgi:hypothetical protein
MRALLYAAESLRSIGVAIPARLERANLQIRNLVLCPIELRNRKLRGRDSNT